jgi:hypothetical protein
MNLSEYEFKQLSITAVFRIKKELIILAHHKGIHYLGTRIPESSDGMVCDRYPTPELALKAYFLTMTQLNSFPSSVDTPDLFRSQITLDEATAGFKKMLNETGHSICPCCEHISRIYRRHIAPNGLMALAFMVHKNVKWRDGKVNDEKEIPFMHVRELPKTFLLSQEFTKLVHWGLTESARNTNTKKHTSGLWRPTIQGANFVRGYFPVRSHIVMYRRRFLRYEGELVYFNNVVDRFDYEKMMNELGGVHKELNDV